jgi:hypothetical protein
MQLGSKSNSLRPEDFDTVAIRHRQQIFYVGWLIAVRGNFALTELTPNAE